MPGLALAAALFAVPMLLTFLGVRWILRRIGAWDTETREPD